MYKISKRDWKPFDSFLDHQTLLEDEHIEITLKSKKHLYELIYRDNDTNHYALYIDGDFEECSSDKDYLIKKINQKTLKDSKTK
jgi:hypothetical protein